DDYADGRGRLRRIGGVLRRGRRGCRIRQPCGVLQDPIGELLGRGRVHGRERSLGGILDLVEGRGTGRERFVDLRPVHRAREMERVRTRLRWDEPSPVVAGSAVPSHLEVGFEREVRLLPTERDPDLQRVPESDDRTAVLREDDLHAVGLPDVGRLGAESDLHVDRPGLPLRVRQRCRRSDDQREGGERARYGERADRTVHGELLRSTARGSHSGSDVYRGGPRPPSTSRSVNAGTPVRRGSGTREPRGGVGEPDPKISPAASAARRTSLITAATNTPTASCVTAPTGRTCVRSCSGARAAIRSATSIAAKVRNWKETTRDASPRNGI